MSQRMRVVQFIPALDPVHPNGGGGASLYGLRLAMQLDPACFESSVCALWSHGTPREAEWQRRLADAGVQVYFLAERTPGRLRRQRLDAIRAFGSFLDQQRPHIVTSHTEPADLIVMLNRRRQAGRPILVRTAHNEREATARPIWGELLWQLYPLCFDQEVGVATRVVERLDGRPLARWRGSRALCMPNGIAVEQVLAHHQGSDIRSSLGLPADAFLLGSVGRLEPQKGYAWLIRLFKAFLLSGADGHLLLVGEGGLYPALQRLVCSLELEGRVLLLGGRSDSWSIIEQLDLFISSSLWEGLPTVVMEAMALETPVIATAVSGNLDLVLPYETGLLIPVEDQQAGLRALRYLYDRPAERRRLARAARQHVVRFHFKQTVRRYEALYQRLLAGQAVGED